MNGEVQLWQLIQDWLPDAGWQILTVEQPWDLHKQATIRRGNTTVAIIHDDKVEVWACGHDSKPIKAVDPMFFCKLDLALTSIFSNSEWYKMKLSNPYGNRPRKKIWPT